MTACSSALLKCPLVQALTLAAMSPLDDTIPDAQPSPAKDAASQGMDTASVCSEAPSAWTSAPASAAGEKPSAPSQLMDAVMGAYTDDDDDDDTRRPKGHVTCHRCRQHIDKSEAQTVGSKTKKVFKCNSCNALNARMSRLLKKSGAFAKDWNLVSDEEKQEFYAKSKELQGSALQDGMQATINFCKRRVSRVKGGSSGHQPSNLTNLFWQTYAFDSCTFLGVSGSWL